MIVSQDTIPSFKRVIEDWTSLCILSDKKEETKRKFYQNIWRVVEKSLPIFIHSTETRLTNSQPNVWYVRVLSHKIDGKCIDIRQFKKVETETGLSYEPTENGITLPINDWFTLLDTAFKFIRKYKEK